MDEHKTYVSSTWNFNLPQDIGIWWYMRLQMLVSFTMLVQGLRSGKPGNREKSQCSIGETTSERERGRDRETKRTCILVPHSQSWFLNLYQACHLNFQPSWWRYPIKGCLWGPGPEGQPGLKCSLVTSLLQQGWELRWGGPRSGASGCRQWMCWELQTQRQRHRKVIEKILKSIQKFSLK